jgi:hypothetical protein
MQTGNGQQFDKMPYSGHVLGYHSGECEDCGLLSCGATHFGQMSAHVSQETAASICMVNFQGRGQ